MPRRVRSGLQEIVLEHINDAVLAIDRDGKIVIFNALASAVFETSEETALGKKVWEIIKFSEFSRILMSTVKESDARTREQIILFPHNRLFQVRIFQARGDDSKLLGAIAILKDLSEFSKIEKAVNKYVANVSHELKTPLTSIKGYVETLLEGAYYSDPEVTRKFLQVINEETNRMTRLILGMLELVRISGAPCQIELKPHSIYPLVHDAARVLIPIAQQNNINLSFKVPEDLPPVLVNEDKIKQVFINLIDNAIKFTGLKKEGHVVIEARDENKYMRISVSDDGIGIAPEHIDKVFERFYRVKEGPPAELGGTGLGLSITREIIEEHKGKITVESEVGKGTKFTITLPLAGS
jgi:two-component system, OmpR family, phosphate regulon sensor histidine kinase PhoR